jgi:syntaxin 1B/2/3
MNPVSRAFANARADDDAIKKEDMKRLEKALVEIREAFLQIATLVESQGEMLDCIEFSTVNAKNYAHQANLQLIKARSKQRKRTWLYCYFICSGIILLGVIVVIVLMLFKVIKT